MDLYEELKNVKIPYIDNCVITHPKYEWLKTNFEIWGNENNADVSRGVMFNDAEWTANIFPYCKSKDRLLDILLLCRMTYMVDDDMDKLVKSGNPQLLKKYFETLSDTLENPEKNNEGNGEAFRMLSKIWLRITERLTDKQAKRIATSLNDWFVLSIFLQNNYRMKNRYIPVSTYIEYRRVDILMQPFINFIEPALEFELKDHIRESYLIKKLHTLILERTAIAHDLLSGLTQEYMDGEIMNCVFAYKYEKQYSFQDAVNDVDLRIKNIDVEFKRCEQILKSDKSLLAEQPMIMEYITALNIMAYGFIQWNTNSLRYTTENVKFSVKDVNWNQIKESFENNSEMESHCYPSLKDIIGENNASKYLL